HPADGIGIPATITFESNPNVELVGKTTEIGKLLHKYSELFKKQEKYYEGKVPYKQKIKLKSDKPTEVKLSAETKVCDEEKCLPPDWLDFSVKIIPKSKPEETVAKTEETEPEETLATVDSTEIIPDTVANNDTIREIPAITAAPDEPVEEEDEDKSLWGIFIAGIGGGLLALVMPCIYPMIPLTVSLFTKQSNSRAQGIFKAMIYGLSIIIIFVGLAYLATVLLGQSALNEFSTNP